MAALAAVLLAGPVLPGVGLVARGGWPAGSAGPCSLPCLLAPSRPTSRSTSRPGPNRCQAGARSTRCCCCVRGGPEGRLVLGTGNNTIYISDLETRRLVHSLAGHTNYIH